MSCDRLQKNAFLLLLVGRRFQCCDNGFIEDILKSSLSQCRALYVLDGVEVLRQVLTLLRGDRLLALLRQLLNHSGIIAQIYLSTNDEAGNTGTVVPDFGKPFLLDVLETGGRVDREADEENVGLGVTQGTQTVVILLSSGIEQPKRVRFVADHNSDGIVVEDGWNVLARKLIRSVRDEQTSLAYCSVSDDDTLDCSDNHVYRTLRKVMEDRAVPNWRKFRIPRVAGVTGLKLVGRDTLCKNSDDRRTDRQIAGKSRNM